MPARIKINSLKEDDKNQTLKNIISRMSNIKIKITGYEKH